MTYKARFLLLAIVGAALFAQPSSGEDAVKLSPAARLVAADRVLVIAHRGDNRVAPENTLPAFASAVKVGADLVELDYLHSADGLPVVFHDDTLDRCTDACELWGGKKILLARKPAAELAKLDAGRWFDPKFAGTRIPTLDQALDVIQAGSVTLIERKEGDAATCVALLDRKGLRDQVVVQAFDWDYLADCHRRDPMIVLGALGEKELTPQLLDKAQTAGARVIGWREKDLAKADIDAIHARGLKAWAWTVNDTQRAAELLDAGLDGIISDTPAAMLQLVKDRQTK